MLAKVQLPAGKRQACLLSRQSPVVLGRPSRSTGAPQRSRGGVVQAELKPATESASGVVFQPFLEVKGELSVVANTDNSQKSFARLDYAPECETAVNEQINVEYNISYVYHALYSFFDRDNVGLPGLASYFKHASLEEREHAEKLMQFQNIRGGRIKLQGILPPESEFNHPEKGDALYAMELALSLEKLNFQKLRNLHTLAAKHNDAHMTDFIEGDLLDEQARAIKEVSVYVSQLRRVGKGHGVYDFDRDLVEKLEVA